MNRNCNRAVVICVIALAACGTAQATNNGQNQRRCSDTTLRGLYVFGATGYNIVADAAQPKAILEFIRFDGRGAIVSPAATVSLNGVITVVRAATSRTGRPCRMQWRNRSAARSARCC